jgi:putative endonuclease
MKKKKWSLYVVRTTDNFLYTGISTDVKRRFVEHFTSTKGARFFRAHKAEKLFFTQIIGSQGDALKVEYAFKRLSRKRKESLINCGKIFYEIDGRKVKLSGTTF